LSQFKGIISRIKEFASLENDLEVAKLLDLKPNTFSERKKKGSIPFKQLVKYSEENKIDLDWLLNGKRKFKLNIGSEGIEQTNESRSHYSMSAYGNVDLDLDKVLDRQKEIYSLINSAKDRYEIELSPFVVALIAEITAEYSIKKDDLYRLVFMLKSFSEDLKKEGD